MLNRGQVHRDPRADLAESSARTYGVMIGCCA